MLGHWMTLSVCMLGHWMTLSVCMLGHWMTLSVCIFYTAFNPTIAQFNKKITVTSQYASNMFQP